MFDTGMDTTMKYCSTYVTAKVEAARHTQKNENPIIDLDFLCI